MTRQPLTLDDPLAVDPTVVGAKANGLAELRRAGFDVPDAYVLPIGIAASWPRDEADAPAELRNAVTQACADLDGPLAIRSSATWEDGRLRAHAGATTTVLDVRGPTAALAAIRACLDGSAAARRRTCGPEATGDLAIIIQRLVPADFAGVAFTADPVTGNRDVVRIAATPGLGDALVDGETIGLDLTVRGSRVQGDLEGLPRELVLRIADVARKVEAHHGRPQDIEWAVADGQLQLLQTRPITVLPTQPRMPTGNNWQKDTAHYPEPMTTFGWTVLKIAIDGGRAVFDDLGLLIRGLEEELVGGEVYSRVRPAIGSADSAGSPPPAPLLGLAARIVPELRRRTAAARQALAENRPRQWMEAYLGHERTAYDHAVRHLRSIRLDALDDAALLAHLEDVVPLLRGGGEIHFRLTMHSAFCLHRLHVLVGDTIGWDDARIAGMMAGHSPATRASEAEMERLREQVRGHPEIRVALEARPAEPFAVLENLAPDLGRSVRNWAVDHGWGMVNYDAGVAVVAERPSTITRLLLADPAPPDPAAAEVVADEARRSLPPAVRADFDEALAEARAAYPLREDNTVVVYDRPSALVRQWMVEVARRLAERDVLPSPEDAVHLTLDELKALIVGGHIDDVVGRIQQRRNEEAWARAFPGPAYIGKQASPPDISRLPSPLRRVNEPTLWVVAHEYPTPVERPDDAEVLLAGVAASPGTAIGPVRVIRSQRDMGLLQEGEILVCQITTPAWSPVFPLAAAVVADGGGVLSHAAIAAREHGLPAVLGTARATSVLTDGQHVMVDGGRGVVRQAT